MKNILFVCTGNTCRSPMAQAVLAQKAKRRNLDFQVYSAGIFAQNGAPVSENALLALGEKGYSIEHTAQPVTEALMENAHYIFGLTEYHAKTLCDTFPRHCQKVFVSPIEIADPFGGDLETYRGALLEIEKNIDLILSHLCAEEL